MQKMPTLILRDEIFIQHEPGLWHPESPERLKTIYSALDNRLDPEDGYLRLSPREASFEELCWNHDPRYVRKIQDTAGIEKVQLDPDTATSAKSWQAASQAVGGSLLCLQEIFESRAANGFALVRPPGHHAERDRAMGFCLFNNVAICAHYALKVLGAERVMIVDWDLHHGNGTQHSFYGSDRVLYLSTHQYPYYPGTGALEETGTGAGQGFTVNVPLTAGKGDSEYSTIFARLVLPIARAYRPDLILVSAGFDIFEADPLGGMNVSARGFGLLAAYMLLAAEEVCEGRLLFLLEGGYDLKGLASGVIEVLKACRKDRDGLAAILAEQQESDFRELDQALAHHKAYWPL